MKLIKLKPEISKKIEIGVAISIILADVLFYATDTHLSYHTLGCFMIASGFVIAELKDKTSYFIKTMFFGTGFVLVLDCVIHLINDIKEL